MIKIENFKTFTDEILPEVYVAVQNVNINQNRDGKFEMDFNFEMSLDPDMRNRVDTQMNNIRIEYDLGSEVNAVKMAYEYLSNLSSLKDGSQYPVKEVIEESVI